MVQRLLSNFGFSLKKTFEWRKLREELIAQKVMIDRTTNNNQTKMNQNDSENAITLFYHCHFVVESAVNCVQNSYFLNKWKVLEEKSFPQPDAGWMIWHRNAFQKDTFTRSWMNVRNYNSHEILKGSYWYNSTLKKALNRHKLKSMIEQKLYC